MSATAGWKYAFSFLLLDPEVLTELIQIELKI
jgi:hypothetical protein